MSVKEFSNENIFKLLSTESRRANLTPSSLAKVHCKLGELLSYKFLEEFHLEHVEIQHVQGVRKGLGFPKNEKILILVLMRGGLYVAEGFKEIFDGNYTIEFLNESNLDLILKRYNLKKYRIIIIDSVINTGKSILNILNKIEIKKNIYIISLVMQRGSVDIFNKMENINCYVARISDNFYIGKGHTDTGNRLFGTIKEEK